MSSLVEIKNQANILKEFLSQENHKISQSACYQVIAKMNGYKNWNTMRADLTKPESSKFNNDSVFTNNHIVIADTALLSIANIGRDGKLNEDAIRVLFYFLYKLDNNSVLLNENDNPARFLLESARFYQALHLLIENHLIVETNYDEYSTYEINPNYFWKGTSDKHRIAIEALCKNSLTSKGEASPNINSQSDMGEMSSLFELELEELRTDFAKKIFKQ